MQVWEGDENQSFQKQLRREYWKLKTPTKKKTREVSLQVVLTPLEKSEFINWDVIDWSVTITLKKLYIP